MRIRVETIRSVRSYTIEQAVLAKGIHLLPFRTEKLSPSAPMLLRQSTWESRSPPLFKTKKPNTVRCWAFFICSRLRSGGRGRKKLFFPSLGPAPKGEPSRSMPFHFLFGVFAFARPRLLEGRQRAVCLFTFYFMFLSLLALGS